VCFSRLAPSGGPTTVFIKRLGPTVLEITWSPPEVEKRNGIIVSYRLCAKEVSDSSPCHNNVVVGGTERRLPIAGLKPYTWYAVSVEAGTTGGYGPQTEFHHRTGEWGKYIVLLSYDREEGEGINAGWI
jgi:netrin-G3 ligand